MQGEMVQKILHIYLRNNDSISDALNELACSILPQVHEFLVQNHFVLELRRKELEK